MKTVLYSIHTLMPGSATLMTDWVGKVLAMFTPHVREVRSQRMCPFCGLITPRSKRFCLECGKSFGEIQIDQQMQNKNE